MKNKLIYIIPAVIVVIALSVYFVLNNPFLKDEAAMENDNAKTEENGQAEDSESNSQSEDPSGQNDGTDSKEDPPTEQVANNIVTDDFEITPLPGWEGRPAPEGVLAIAIKPTEIMTSDAVKIGFKSYFAITKDSLREKTKEEYISFIREELKKISSSVTFDTIWTTKVNGKDATVLDISINQQSVDFKVSIFLVWNGEDVWAISFNTTEDKWNEYKDDFFTSGSSFKLK